ncbi:hypothetical protein H0A36_28680 [Endozoicomonas sp. SM1973]|uniref:Uncharacterized protein n=1 Tax=Spartinivicinus marinus TaxID=2994442 RepID=A0A853IIZ1_9GAMM|nr:hypothetical protein [Spartinivicinus marinus]MCX4024762.1 hypothetical protein [Spartinivicinus marinus]NYZ69994.1 hypothetical protein [Spartinivicinus marinus]
MENKPVKHFGGDLNITVGEFKQFLEESNVPNETQMHVGGADFGLLMLKRGFYDEVMDCLAFTI